MAQKRKGVGTRWKDEPIKYTDVPGVPDGVSLRSCPALLSAWQFSAKRLNEMCDKLKQTLNVDWASVVLAGSYGRMDACKSSDADFLLLIDHAPAKKNVLNLITQIRDALSLQNFPMPNPQGLFSQPIDINEITTTIGSKDDTLFELARRMVLLLEIRCVYNEPLYRKAIHNVLSTYLRYQYKEPDKQPLFLLNELIRYFRSICVNYELNFWHDHEKWAIRNAKLRHSRVLMYFSLLLLLLNSSLKKNKLSYLSDTVNLTPIERICQVYHECGENDVFRVLGPYSIFVKHMSDIDFRTNLSKADYDNRYASPEYALLKTTSEALYAEMTRFILDRRRFWPQKVFSNLMF